LASNLEFLNGNRKGIESLKRSKDVGLLGLLKKKKGSKNRIRGRKDR